MFVEESWTEVDISKEKVSNYLGGATASSHLWGGGGERKEKKLQSLVKEYLISFLWILRSKKKSAR